VVGGGDIPYPLLSTLVISGWQKYVFIQTTLEVEQEDTGLGKKGGAILRAHQKKILARFHIFLKSLISTRKLFCM
jgi:hypothetical protein